MKKDIISKAEIKTTAELANISLTEEDYVRFTESLQIILEHFDVISKIPSSEAEDLGVLTKVVNSKDMRKDVPASEIETEPLVRNASDFEDGFFFIPGIMNE